jgi:lysozyme
MTVRRNLGEAVSIAAGLCRRFEGRSLSAYLCPAGVATIGYGATRYLDGRPVRLTDSPITRDAAERMLVLQLERVYMPQALAACPGLTGGRLAALTDFTFNLGVGALRASTLRRRVNAGDWAAVPGELRKWVRGGGRVLRGLVLRREAEIELL